MTESHQDEDSSAGAAARQLITVVAHDLRNFLAPVRGRLELMRRRALHEGRTDYLHDTEQATRTIDRLRRLIDDLLDVSRLERGPLRLNRKTVDVVDVVEEAVEAFSDEQTHIQLLAPRELRACADPDRLYQAVANLLANAVAHSGVGATIDVAVSRLTRNQQMWVQVCVADRGPGIPASLLPRLFECFSTGPGSSGLGLGLYLVRAIADAHGGNVELHSIPGQGARFTIAIPDNSSPRITRASV